MASDGAPHTATHDYVASEPSPTRAGMRRHTTFMTGTQFDADEATALRAEQVVEQLADALDNIAAEGSIQAIPGNSRVFIVAYGWWAHTTRSSQAVLTLRRAGLEHEASPIIRNILQHSLALQWLIDIGDKAVDAIEEYSDNNVRLLSDTMGKANWPPVPGLNLATPPKPATANPLVTKLKNFEELCVAYNAQQLYVPFRLMSAYAHPTAVGARAYLDERSGTISASVVESTTNTLIIQTAMCLIQAGKAFNQLLVGSTMGNALSKADETLGMQVTQWTPR